MPLLENVIAARKAGGNGGATYSQAEFTSFGIRQTTSVHESAKGIFPWSKESPKWGHAELGAMREAAMRSMIWTMLDNPSSFMLNNKNQKSGANNGSPK